MVQELKIKYYNATLKAGYNDFRKVYIDDTWVDVKVHAGRLVYGKQRKPFSKLRAGISHKNFIVREFLPF